MYNYTSDIMRAGGSNHARFRRQRIARSRKDIFSSQLFTVIIVNVNSTVQQVTYVQNMYTLCHAFQSYTSTQYSLRKYMIISRDCTSSSKINMNPVIPESLIGIY